MINTFFAEFIQTFLLMFPFLVKEIQEDRSKFDDILQQGIVYGQFLPNIKRYYLTKRCLNRFLFVRGKGNEKKKREKKNSCSKVSWEQRFH